MLRMMLSLVLLGQMLIIASCCVPKRWSSNDPREATPLPTPTILATAEISVGMGAGSNTTTSNAIGK